MIESERLILRRFKDSDLAPFGAYRNDPEVARYQAWDSCDEQEAVAFIREMESAQADVPGEWFQFAIESKKTGALIGDCALRVDEHEPYRAEIGFPANPYENALASAEQELTPEHLKFIEDHGSGVLSDEFYSYLVEESIKTLRQYA